MDPSLMKSETISERVMEKIKGTIESMEIKDYGIDVTKGAEVGDNFMGFIGRVTINGKDKSGAAVQLNWIVKVAPQVEMFRKIIPADAYYAREVLMYESVFPAFKKFQDERGVLEPFDEYPSLVFSYVEPLNESLAMDDLKTIGYVLRPKKKTLDYGHVKLAVRTFAKFHAVSYAMKDQERDRFEMIVDNAKRYVFEGMGKEMVCAQQGMMDMMVKMLGFGEGDKIYGRLKIFQDNFFDIALDAIKTKTEYSVITHGDSWTNNLLWKYDDLNNPGRPTDIRLIDFQQSHYTSPAIDLSYFIFTCTDKELRDRHYDEIVRLYHYTLCSQLIEMGSDPEKVIPFSALLDELKKFSIAGLYYSIMITALVTREADEIPNMEGLDMTPESFNEVLQKQSKNQAVYIERVRNVIVDYYEKGYMDVVDKYADVNRDR